MRTLTKIRRVLSRFGRNSEGGLAIEIAFGLPIAVVSVVGLIELSLMIFVNTLVEGGIREASRYGKTGLVINGLTREQAMFNIISDHTMGMVDLGTATITQQVYPNFENVGKPEPYVDANSNGSWDSGESFTDVNGNTTWDADPGVAGAGGPGDVVLYKMEFDWELMTPLFAQMIGRNGGKVPMSVSTVIRNEPWQVVGAPPPPP